MKQAADGTGAIKKCVVTGASGLIGSHLVEQLRHAWAIFRIGRTAPQRGATDDQVQSLAIDLVQHWDVNVLPPTVDAVIHLAQSEHFREFPKQAEQVFRVNTLSTLRLLDYARQAGARTFVLASSGGIYGYGDQEFSEDLAIPSRDNLGFYLGTKQCAEILAENYTSFMNVIVLRFFFVYGLGQRRSMLIPRLVQSVIDSKPINLDGSEGIRLNPTHVSDAVNAVDRALALPESHKINVGGPEVLSLRQIGNMIGELVNKEPKFETQAGAEPRHLIGDIRKMSRLLEAPKMKFKEGVADYIHNTYPDLLTEGYRVS